MKNIKDSTVNSAKAIILGLILATGVSYIFAWTGPTSAPPSGNVSAPINAGYNSQSKLGQLYINTATSTTYAQGLLAFGESVFTSNASGSYAIQVNDGTAAAGKVLTAKDSNGDATWQTPSSGGASSTTAIVFINPVIIANKINSTGSTTINLQSYGVPSTATAVVLQAFGFANEDDKGGSTQGENGYDAPYIAVEGPNSSGPYNILMQDSGSSNLVSSGQGTYPTLISAASSSLEYFASTGWNSYTIEVIGYVTNNVSVVTQTAGVSSIIAGTNITISPSNGTGNVTINASTTASVSGSVGGGWYYDSTNGNGAESWGNASYPNTTPASGGSYVYSCPTGYTARLTSTGSINVPHNQGYYTYYTSSGLCVEN